MEEALVTMLTIIGMKMDAVPGSPIDSGATISLNPTTTTTYFVRIESSCFTGPCVNVTVNVLQPSTAPASIISPTTTVCPGQAINLTVQGGNLGSNANWEWYTNTCGGNSIEMAQQLRRVRQFQLLIFCTCRRILRYFKLRLYNN